MSELTKEHLEQALKGLATKDDLLKAVAPLATSEQVEDLARILLAGNRGCRDRRQRRRFFIFSAL